jgi:hypothetical protein
LASRNRILNSASRPLAENPCIPSPGLPEEGP